MADSTENTLVLVTGAANYVACNVIKQLQAEGYQVRGVVSSLENEEETKTLQDLCPEKTIDLITADPLKPEEWESAVKDSAYVIHAVSPYQVAPAASVEEDEVIKVAVEGTQNVLKACVAAKTVKRVVLTSTLSAVAVTVPVDNKQLTEADWAATDKMDVWTKSKTMAEQAAWDYLKELPDEDKIELSVVNAATVLGPVDKNDQLTNIEVIKRLMERSLPFVPKINLAVVDIKDLANAHLKAMTATEAAGNRHIVYGHVVWMKEIAQHLAKEFRPQGFNVPTIACPYAALWVTAIFDKKNKALLPQVGKMISYDNTRMKEVLGITEPRDIKDSLVDMGNAMIEHGLVVKKVKKVKPVKEKAAATAEEGGEEKPKENGDVKEEDKKDEEEKKDEEKGEEDKGDKIEDKEEKCDEKIEDKVEKIEDVKESGDADKIEKIESSEIKEDTKVEVAA